jgi:hypothetical protein
MLLQRNHVTVIIISYCLKAADDDEPEPSVSEVVIPCPEVLHPNNKVPVASCSPLRVHCPMIEESREEDKDEDDDDVITEDERQLITHLERQGVPRELAVVRTLL